MRARVYLRRKSIISCKQIAVLEIFLLFACLLLCNQHAKEFRMGYVNDAN